jgi:GH25 family lysozyme M1 (1,4-beta-N-acetylmuramidase)
MNPICVDLSHWNPTPDWAELKAAGTLGIIHKATEGTSYVDKQLFKRAKPAIDAGLLWSTYHFLNTSSTYAQMDHYLSTIDPVLGERVVLDHEDAGVSLDRLKQAIENLLDLRPDLQITLYSGHLIKDQLGARRDNFLAEKTSLWIAQYTGAATPIWPVATWPKWSLWQYTDKAEVDGISKPVDGNRWNGDEAGFRKWMSPTSAVPETPEPGKQVIISVQVPPGVPVQVIVNGEIVR